MYVLGKQLQDLPIVSLQTGQTIAHTGRPIIDPDRLEIQAFYCTAGRLLKNSAVLLVRDIRQLGRDGLLIDSFEEIEDAGDIVRLADLIKQHFSPLGLPVVNESGIRLGKVEEYTVNIENYQIQKLYLKQSLLKNLLMNSLVVDRSQIMEVTARQILVRDASIKEPLLGPQPVIQE
jgi:sporulation protein YlmC with PRC-barrel domain